MSITIEALEVADEADAWTRAGFTVDADNVCRIGGVDIRLVGRDHGRGIVGWSLRGLTADGPVDGIATSRSTGVEPAVSRESLHPNGISAIDHVVVLSPHLARTVEALAAIGVAPRRERDGELGGRPIRQIFFRFGAVIIEVVGSPDATAEAPASLWGVTYVAKDIDATAAYFAGHTTAVKDAVQPGRRITTLRQDDYGMSVRTAMISAPILSA